MSDDKANPWHQLSVDIADGKEINWSHWQQLASEDPELLDQLSQIETISKLLGNGQQAESAEPHQPKGLFDWGHLQVTALIGEGGFGEVYRAYDSTLDREVALKLLKQDQLAPYQSRAFIQEARRLAKVRNRHVLAVHGASVHEGRVGMWSDLISGADLSVGQNQPHPCDELLDIAEALSHALQAVHEAGIIHGDIKASNVMRDAHGRIILMDFGAGIERPADQPEAPQQPASSITATPLYMAPELLSGAAVSPASDVYALGVLLFKLATGDYPVAARNLAELTAAHQQPMRSIHRLRADLPAPLKQLISQLLQTEPHKRPNARAIAEQIRRIRELPARRQKRSLVMALFAVLVAGIVFTTLGFYRAEQAAEQTNTVNEFLVSLLSANADLGQGREVRVADLLDEAASNITQTYDGQPLAKAAIHDALGNSYLSLHLPETGLIQLQNSLSIKSAELPADDPGLLKSKTQLAVALQTTGQYEQAKAHYQAVIEQASARPDELRDLIRLATIRLAQVLSRMGDQARAIETLQPIIAQLNSSTQTDEPHAHLAFYVLSQVHSAQARFHDAEQAARTALVWLDRSAKKTMAMQFQLQNSLAIILTGQGRLPEAIALLEDILESSATMYGRNNFAYFNALTNLSAALQEQGAASRAMHLQQQALELAKTIEGFDQLNLIVISINLANSKTSLGDYSGAESLMRETLVLAEQSIGSEDIRTLQLVYNLAELLNLTHRYAEAELLARENHQTMSEVLGAQHPFTWLALSNLAVSLAGQQHHEQAWALFDQSIEQLEALSQAPGPFVEMALKQYCEALLEADQLTTARARLEQLLELQTQLYDEPHSAIAKTRQRLNELTRDQATTGSVIETTVKQR
jgi:serine/threonine protein kinase